jgi:hypothetical protein
MRRRQNHSTALLIFIFIFLNDDPKKNYSNFLIYFPNKSLTLQVVSKFRFSIKGLAA